MWAGNLVVISGFVSTNQYASGLGGSRARSFQSTSPLDYKRNSPHTERGFSSPPYVFYLCILRRTVRRLAPAVYQVNKTQTLSPSPVDS